MNTLTHNCTKCHKANSIYYRPYSGERLCEACFNDSLFEKIKKTVGKYKMFEYNSRIAVGVSGGKDSLTLLRILNELEKDRPYAELVAVCIDEGVTGYRDEAISLAEKNCRELDVEMHIVEFKELFGETMDEIAAKERELGTCTYCGVLRRRALNEAAKSVDADRLATGHNLDDMAQSVLLNILRGDVTRIDAFHPGGQNLQGYVRRVKPLCEVPERETTFYAYINNLEFQNLPCPYAEEAMRSDVRRFLNRMEVKRPGTKSIIYQTGLKIRRNIDSGIAGNCKICGSPTRGELCRVCELSNKMG